MILLLSAEKRPRIERTPLLRILLAEIHLKKSISDFINEFNAIFIIVKGLTTTPLGDFMKRGSDWIREIWTYQSEYGTETETVFSSFRQNLRLGWENEADLFIIFGFSLLLAGSLYIWREYHRRVLMSKFKALEAEKHRVSLELHDGIGARLLKIERTLPSHLPTIKMALQEAHEELRDLSRHLDAQRKAQGSLTDILADYLGQRTFVGQLQVNIDFFPAPFDVDNTDLKFNLFRVIQELLANTLKHSNATACFIRLAYTGKKLELQYTDNGEGITKPLNSEGMGLRNIRERVTLLKGRFMIDPDSEGFAARIELPVRKKQIIYTKQWSF